MPHSRLEGPLGRRLDRRVVVTRLDARRRLTREIVLTLKERYAVELCDTVIAESVALAESPARGLDVFSYDPRSRGAQDYARLAAELDSAGFFN